MDETQGTSVELPDELDMWMHSCDICLEVATSPVDTTCGHFFCRSCLYEAFQGEPAKPCLVCKSDLLEETAQSFPINRIGAPAEPTPEVANSEIPNAGNRGPAARTPTTARSSLISIARMDVVQDYLEEENEHIHNIQLTLSRCVSDLRGERTRELEQVVQNLMQMNLSVLQEMEDCEHDRRRMRRRILELVNPTAHGTSAFAKRSYESEEESRPRQLLQGSMTLPQGLSKADYSQPIRSWAPEWTAL